MEIGELSSDDLGEILEKSRVLEDRFKDYCRQQNKFFYSKLFLGPDKVIMKCYLINNEDSREIKNS
jgi:hypothetical protein